MKWLIDWLIALPSASADCPLYVACILKVGPWASPLDSCNKEVNNNNKEVNNNNKEINNNKEVNNISKDIRNIK